MEIRFAAQPNTVQRNYGVNNPNKQKIGFSGKIEQLKSTDEICSKVETGLIKDLNAIREVIGIMLKDIKENRDMYKLPKDRTIFERFYTGLSKSLRGNFHKYPGQTGTGYQEVMISEQSGDVFSKHTINNQDPAFKYAKSLFRLGEKLASLINKDYIPQKKNEKAETKIVRSMEKLDKVIEARINRKA